MKATYESSILISFIISVIPGPVCRKQCVPKKLIMLCPAGHVETFRGIAVRFFGQPAKRLSLFSGMVYYHIEMIFSQPISLDSVCIFSVS